MKSIFIGQIISIIMTVDYIRTRCLQLFFYCFIQIFLMNTQTEWRPS